MLRFVLGLILGIALTVAAPLIGMAAGLFDLSAAQGPGTLERVVGHWAFERWLQTRAPDDLVNLSPPTTESFTHGLDLYARACVACHGAPEVSPAPWAERMVPPPPDLARAGNELAENELFWIIDQGARLTGMPAFGGMLTEEDIWSVVRVVRDLEHVTPAQKARLQATVDALRPPEAQAPGHALPVEPGT